MAVSPAFDGFVRELLAGLGAVRTRRMFGGLGVYADEVFFAIADDEAVWIKVDDVNEPAFVAEACPLFTYRMKDGATATMRYRRLPETAMDDPEEAVRWARLGVEAALRKRGAAKPRRRGQGARGQGD
jgi:DNA transformation protein